MKFTYYAVIYDAVAKINLSERKTILVELRGSTIKIAEPVSFEILSEGLSAELHIFLAPNDVVPVLKQPLGQIHKGNLVNLRDEIHPRVTP